MKRINEQTVEKWLEHHAPMVAEGAIAAGTAVGGWRIAALVARGGSGEVYRAVHAETSQIAALKILHRDDDAARARFAREISILSENNSPFFPAFYGAGEYGGRPWYAMELLEPFTLPSGDGAVASFVTDVCRGAGTLHALGYVHRDIKPANILSRNGEPVLIDLGLAKATGGPAVPLGPAPSIVDGHAVGVGTPGYSAPEQFTGGDIFPASDIHAIGILASECLGGNPPLCWRRIIRRATSSLPSERYRDCAAMARAIRLRHWPQWTATVLAAVAVTAVLFVNGGPRAIKTGRERIPARFSPADLAEGVDCGEGEWATDAEAPWALAGGADFRGGDATVGTAPAEGASRILFTVAGPARVVFHFRRSSYTAVFRVALKSEDDAFPAVYSLDDFDADAWHDSAVYIPSGTNIVTFSVAHDASAPGGDCSVVIDEVRIERGDLDEERAATLETRGLDARLRGEWQEARRLLNAAWELRLHLAGSFGAPYRRHLADVTAARSPLFLKDPGGLTFAQNEMRKALAIRRELAETDPETFQPLVEKTLRDLSMLR